MFRTPYRWLPRTIWPNLRSCWCDFTQGIRNLWRWLPVIWFDQDFDWCYTARILEIKLRRLADCMEHGHRIHGKRDAKQARVCAMLLKRLITDEYFDNAGYRPETWHTIPSARRNWIAQHAEKMAERDHRYLGMLLGKYLRNWWD